MSPTDTSRSQEAATDATRHAHPGSRGPAADAEKSGRDPDEIELTLAMREYQRSSGRLFPLWSEVLQVIRGLGYEKPGE